MAWLFNLSQKNSKKQIQRLVKLAVAQNGLALEFAPDLVKANLEVANLAVAQNPMALKFVSYALHETIIIQNGMALQYASSELKNNLDLVKLAVAQNGRVFQFLDEGIKTQLRQNVRFNIKNSKLFFNLSFEDNAKNNAKDYVFTILLVGGKTLETTTTETTTLAYSSTWRNVDSNTKFYIE